jgi:hypothetical protein
MTMFPLIHRPLLLICLAFVATPIWAQNKTTGDPSGVWKESAETTVLFNQAAFNEDWQGGGVSNIAGNLSMTYALNYKSNGLTWDTKATGEYGAAKIKTQDDMQKTNDRFEILSVAGKKINDGQWYYSGLFNFKTQFDSGFEPTERTEILNGIPVKITSNERNSKFFSPAYFLMGPGILWKKDDDLKLNFAPATGKLIIVDRQFTDPNDRRNRLDGSGHYFGVAANKTTRTELGLALNGYAKFEIMPNVGIENIIGIYANYLDRPENIDIDYTANLTMRVNNLITTNIAFQAIYDDNAVKGFQIREALGIGVTYKLK